MFVGIRDEMRYLLVDRTILNIFSLEGKGAKKINKVNKLIGFVQI